MSWDVTELARRMAQMLLVGTISAVDVSDPTQPRCEVTSGEVTTPMIPWVAARAGEDAEFWCPDIGEQALVLSPFGDPAQGVALVGLFQAAMPAPGTNPDVRVTKYKDGATVQYDRAAHAYSVDVQAGGTITLQVGGMTAVLSDTGINITGGDVVADGISLKNHTHIDPQGGNTGPPVG